MINVEEILERVLKEVTSAQKKFPAMASPHEGFSILHEEFDEMWDEIKRNDFDGALAEALQVAAMAVRYILDMTDYTPPKAATVRPVQPALVAMTREAAEDDETVNGFVQPRHADILKRASFLVDGLTDRFKG